MGDDPSRHHVGAVADARGQVPDRGGRDAELRQVVEPGNPGVVAPDPGIVEDRRGHPELGRDIGRINTAMRPVDDDRTPASGPMRVMLSAIRIGAGLVRILSPAQRGKLGP